MCDTVLTFIVVFIYKSLVDLILFSFYYFSKLVYNWKDVDLVSRPAGVFRVKKHMSSTWPSLITTIVVPLNKAPK